VNLGLAEILVLLGTVGLVALIFALIIWIVRAVSKK